MNHSLFKNRTPAQVKTLLEQLLEKLDTGVSSHWHPEVKRLRSRRDEEVARAFATACEEDKRKLIVCELFDKRQQFIGELDANELSSVDGTGFYFTELMEPREVLEVLRLGSESGNEHYQRVIETMSDYFDGKAHNQTAEAIAGAMSCLIDAAGYDIVELSSIVVLCKRLVSCLVVDMYSEHVSVVMKMFNLPVSQSVEEAIEHFEKRYI